MNVKYKFDRLIINAKNITNLEPQLHEMDDIFDDELCEPLVDHYMNDNIDSKLVKIRVDNTTNN